LFHITESTAVQSQLPKQIQNTPSRQA
jgi:hypothetical protein